MGLTISVLYPYSTAKYLSPTPPPLILSDPGHCPPCSYVFSQLVVCPCLDPAAHIWISILSQTSAAMAFGLEGGQRMEYNLTQTDFPIHYCLSDALILGLIAWLLLFHTFTLRQTASMGKKSAPFFATLLQHSCCAQDQQGCLAERLCWEQAPPAAELCCPFREMYLDTGNGGSDLTSKMMQGFYPGPPTEAQKRMLHGLRSSRKKTILRKPRARDPATFFSNIL